MPPWVLEEEAPDIWMERARAWNNARVERMQKPKPPVGEVRQVGNKRKKRLI